MRGANSQTDQLAAMKLAAEKFRKEGTKNLIDQKTQNRHRNIQFENTLELMSKCGNFDPFKALIKTKEGLEELEKVENFKNKNPDPSKEFTSESYTARDAYDNFAMTVADCASDRDLHEIVGTFLKSEEARTTSDTFLRNNSLAKSFLQIQISRHSEDGLLPKILKDHFVTTLEKDAQSTSITNLGVSLGCPEKLANSFKGLDTVEKLDKSVLSTSLRSYDLSPIEEEEKASPVKSQPIVTAKRSACGVLCSVIKFSCKVAAGLIMGTMAYECLAKVSLGFTNAVSDLLYKQSLEHYAFDYNMRVSSVLDSASHWLINPNNQPERMAASAIIVVVGASVLAREAYKCYSSRCKTEKGHTPPAAEVLRT